MRSGSYVCDIIAGDECPTMGHVQKKTEILCLGGWLEEPGVRAEVRMCLSSFCDAIIEDHKLNNMS